MLSHPSKSPAASPTHVRAPSGIAGTERGAVPAIGATITQALANLPESSTGGASIAPIAPTHFEPCPECNGSGEVCFAMHHPDDPRSDRFAECDYCDGTGEIDVEVTCQCGSVADGNGFCVSCDAVAETGWALAETSAYGMVVAK